MPKVSGMGKGKPKGSTNVVDRIGALSFDDDEGIKINVYGRAATGKTTFWSTFPGEILAIICSGGHRPGELRSINTPKMKKKVKTVTLESSREMEELVDHVRDSSRIQTVVLDHATGFQDLVLSEVLGLDDIPVSKHWGLASQQQYGQVVQQCKKFLKGLLSLDCNVVIIAQEREFNTDTEEDMILPYVGAGLTPSLCGWLNTAVDYIVQTFIRNKVEVTVEEIGGETVEMSTPGEGVEYCLRVGPHEVFTTKFRLPGGVKADVIPDPNYDKLIQLIR